MRTPSGILHVVDFKTDQIVSIIQPKDYWDDKRHWEVKNNIDTLEFKVFDNTTHAATLMQQNLVLKEVRDGRIVPYVISETEKNADNRSITTFASGAWVQIAKSGIIKPQRIESKTVNEFIDMALVGMKWKRGITEYAGFHTMTIDEFIDPLTFLKKTASLFKLEIQYRVEVVGSQIVGWYVDMVQKRGRDTGKEVELGKDLVGVKRIEHSRDICTALVGFVKGEGEKVITVESINNGLPYITDSDAFQRWNEHGKHKFGFYTPETEDQNMTPKRLLTLMKTEMKKRVNSSVSYEVETQSMGRVFGLVHEMINEGDTIRIKDTGFTPKLYLEARVIAGDESFTDPTQDKYVFGDYREIVDPNEELRKIYNRILSSLGNKQEMLDQLDKLVKEADETASNAKKESEAAKTLAEKVQENIKNNTVEIIESENPPTSNLKDRKTLWLDSSNGKPGILKLWKDGVWEPVVPDVEGMKESILEETSKEINEAKEDLNKEVGSLKEEASKIQGEITDILKEVTDITKEVSDVSKEIKGVESNLNKKVDSLKEEASKIQGELSDVSQEVADVSKEIKGVESNLNNKVESLKEETSKIQSEIADVSKEIESKVDQEWISNELKDKADKSGVYTKEEIKAGFIGKQVYETDKQGNTQKFKDVNTSISQTNEVLKQKAEKSELTKTNEGLTQLEKKTNEIETTAEGTKQTLTDLKTKVDNTKIGGRNILKNTSSSDKKFDFASWQQVAESITPYGIELLKQGGIFTVSADITSHTVGSTKVGLMIHLILSDGGYKQFVNKDNAIAPLETGNITSVLNIGAGDYVGGNLYIRHFSNTDPQSVGTYAKAKIEQGNMKTDYVAAPEDTDEKIDSKVNTDVFEKKTNEIETTVNGIKSTVTNVQESQGKLEKRMTTQEQTADGFKQSIEKIQTNASKTTEQVNKVEQDANGTKQSISKIESNVNGLSGSVDNLTKKTTEIETTVDGIKSSVSSVSSVQDSQGKLEKRMTTQEQTADGFKQSIEKIQTDAGKTSEQVNKIEQDVSGTKQTISKIENNVNDLTGSVEGLTKKTTEIETTVNGIKSTVSNVQTEQGKLEKRMTTQEQTADGFKQSITKLQTDTSKTTERVNKVEQDANGTKQTISKIESNVNGLTGNVNNLTKKTTEIETTVTGIKTSVSSVQDSQGKLEKRMTTQEQTSDGFKQSITKLQTGAGKTSEQINKIEQDANGTKQTISKIESNVNSLTGSVGGLTKTTNEIKTEAGKTNQKLTEVTSKVNNIKVGGRNLLRDSKKAFNTTDYLINQYTLSENWVTGQEYTFVIKGSVPAGQRLGVWQNGGSNNLGYATTSYASGVTYVTFKAVATTAGNEKKLSLYNYPQNATKAVVEWVALYVGNKPMDWTAAPEENVSATDFTKKTTEIETSVNGIKTSVSNVQDSQGKLEKRMTTQEQTADGFKQSIESLTKKDGEISNKLNTVESNVEGTKKTISDVQSDTTKLKQTTTEMKEQAGKVSEKLTSVEKRFDGMEIGGRNLIPNSKINETSSNYGFGIRTTTIDLVAGETYTLVGNGRVDKKAIDDGKSLLIYIYEPTWKYKSINFPIKTTTDSTGTIQFTPNWTGKYTVASYLYPNGGSRAGKVTTNWVALYKGNKPMDWTPAPEDQVSTDEFTKKTNEIVKSVDGVKTTVTKVQNNQTGFDKRIAQVETTASGLSSTVKQLNQTTADQGKKITEANTKLNQQAQAIQAKVEIKQVEDYIATFQIPELKNSVTQQKKDLLADIAKKVATQDYNKKTTELERLITANTTGISLAAKRTEIYTRTEADGRYANKAYVEKQVARIDVTENSIKNTVQKGNVISAINQTAEKIKISANLIDLVGKVEASWLKAGLLQGMTIKTSNSKEYLQMENQVLRFVNQGEAKIVIGFENERKSKTLNPYIILGQGDGNGKNLGSIYKDGNGVYYRFVDYNGAESNIRLTAQGNIGITAQDGIWVTSKRANFTAPIETPGIKFNSFGSTPGSQQGVLWMGHGYKGFGLYYYDTAWNFVGSSQ